MRRPDINVDSFVDIVANSVGILIIVVVMAIVISGRETIRLDEDRSRYSGLLKEARVRKKLMAKAALRIKEIQGLLEKIRVESAAEVEAVERAETEHSSALAKLRLEEEERGTLATRLEKLRVDEVEAIAEVARAEQATREEVSRLAREMGDDLVGRARRERVAALHEGLAAITGEKDALAAEAERLELRTGTLRKEGNDLAEGVASMTKELQELLARSFVTVEVRDPLAQIERERNPVFAECYAPEVPADPDGIMRPCVRLFVGGNYEKAGESLRPTREGESAARVLDEDSAYRRYVAGKGSEFKDKHYLYFVVRPSAYAAFRVARKLAWEAGWKTGWGPLTEGKTIPMKDLVPR